MDDSNAGQLSGRVREPPVELVMSRSKSEEQIDDSPHNLRHQAYREYDQVIVKVTARAGFEEVSARGKGDADDTRRAEKPPQGLS